MGSPPLRDLPLRPLHLVGLVSALIGFASSPVGAQVGTVLCACNPAIYTFELVFDATCDETNVDGLGIENSDCFVSPAGIDQEITDFRPVAVSGVDILELDQQLVPFAFQPVRGSFRNGDTFQYTSVTATDPNLPPERIPGGFQMNVLGVNAIDQDIQNVWIITFTNECGIFPIFTIGEQIGWTRLVNISLPESQYCPFPDSESPTEQPSFEPTVAPSTLAPTNPADTANPSSFPTAFPTENPSESPSLLPTGVNDTARPSSSPVTAEPTLPDQTEAPVRPTCPPFPLKGKGKGKGKGGKGESMDGKGKSGEDNGKGKGGSKGGESKSSKSSKGSKGGKGKSDLIYDKKNKGGKAKNSGGKSSMSKSRGKKLQAKERRSLLQDFFELTGLSKGKMEDDYKDDSRKGKSRGKNSDKDATGIYKSKHKGKGYDDEDDEDDDYDLNYPSPSKGYGKGYHKGSNSTEASSKGKGHSYSEDSDGKGKGSKSSGKGKSSGSAKSSKGSKGYEPPIDPECLPPKKEPPKSGGKNMMMMDLDHGKAGKAGMKKSLSGKAMTMSKSVGKSLPKGSEGANSKGGKGGKGSEDETTKAPSSGKGTGKGSDPSDGGKGKMTTVPIDSPLHSGQPSLLKTSSEPTLAPIIPTVTQTSSPASNNGMDGTMTRNRVRRNYL